MVHTSFIFNDVLGSFGAARSASEANRRWTGLSATACEARGRWLRSAFSTLCFQRLIGFVRSRRFGFVFEHSWCTVLRVRGVGRGSPTIRVIAWLGKGVLGLGPVIDCNDRACASGIGCDPLSPRHFARSWKISRPIPSGPATILLWGRPSVFVVCPHSAAFPGAGWFAACRDTEQAFWSAFFLGWNAVTSAARLPQPEPRPPGSAPPCWRSS